MQGDGDAYGDAYGDGDGDAYGDVIVAVQGWVARGQQRELKP